MLDSYHDPSNLNGVQGVGGSNPLAPTNYFINLRLVAFYQSGFCDTEDLAVNPLSRLTAFFCAVVKGGHILKSWSWFYAQVVPAHI